MLAFVMAVKMLSVASEIYQVAWQWSLSHFLTVCYGSCHEEMLCQIVIVC